MNETCLRVYCSQVSAASCKSVDNGVIAEDSCNSVSAELILSEAYTINFVCIHAPGFGGSFY